MTREGYRPHYNLVGEKFGKVTVLEKMTDSYVSPGGKRHTRWKCVCECGRNKITTTNNLCMGRASSCGCVSYTPEVVDRRAQGNVKKNAGLVEVYGGYRRNARKRGFEFDLKLDDAEEIMSRDCHYCGKKPGYIMKKNERSIPYIYNGIDRVDNKKGYNINNVVTCCFICNRAKMNLSVEEFICMVKNIYNNLLKNNEK